MGVHATVSSKFQVSIPKEVRESQGWKPGQKVAFLQRGRSLVLVPVLDRSELFGILKDANPDNYRDRNDRF